jgi:hypothetical protein
MTLHELPEIRLIKSVADEMGGPVAGKRLLMDEQRILQIP